MCFAAMKPADLRGLIRKGELTSPTTGMCNGYAQGNLVVLPKALAWDFLLFCQRNPKACPLLEVADAGERSFSQFAPGSDIAQASEPLPNLAKAAILLPISRATGCTNTAS